MKKRCIRTVVRFFGMAMLGIALLQPIASRAASGSYQGVIDADSGLGLLGQTMRVDFVYEENTAASFSFTGTSYFDNMLTSMAITIGARTWNWDPAGYSSASLTNDSVQSFAVGVEDAVTFFIGTFNGPSLVGSPVDPEAYSFDLYLHDNLPAGFPDGLAAHATLPTTAPNPDLFRIHGANENTMSLGFYTGDGETGPRYLINAINVSPVPEPSAAWMLLAGLGMLVQVVVRRNARVRRLAALVG